MAARPAIAYGFDRGFADIAAVSAYSIARNSRRDVDIYWITPEADAEAARQIATTTKYVKDLNIRLIATKSDAFSDWKTSFHITAGTYLRLLLPDLIHSERLIYIDADTLVLSDLSELYFMDIGAHLIAGVPDPGAKAATRMPLLPDDPYLNAGVLLLDLDALRADHMLEKAKAIHAQHERDATWMDQCILNKYAERRKFVLDRKWNCHFFANSVKDSEFISLVLNSNPAILHFVGPDKPWQEWCNPLVAKYWWATANELDIATLQRRPITTMNQALAFARVLDLTENYQLASRYKDKIIQVLMNAA